MNLVVTVLLGLLLSLNPSVSRAGTPINTIGSADGTAISGYDTVSFFIEKKAVAGSAEFVASLED